DGARENARLVDPATSLPCEALSDHMLGAPDLCVPLPYAVAPARTFFDGPSCDQVLAFAEPDCNPALVGILARRVGCGLAVDVVEVGASFATAEASIYRLGPDGACRPDSLVRPMRAHAGRASFSAASFATVARPP